MTTRTISGPGENGNLIPCAKQTVHFSASIGIALYLADATATESLAGNADSAMYRAKQAGRRRYCLYDATS